MLAPEEPVYFWMYKVGLKHIPWVEVVESCKAHGITIKDKYETNYWNGWYRSDLYHGAGADDIFNLRKTKPMVSPTIDYFDMAYSDYPEHPYLNSPEIENRWVPCSKTNKPIIQWSNGCLTIGDALAMSGQKYLAENTKGCKFIVIDCDGDHDERLDMQTIAFLWRWANETHRLSKPKFINEYLGYEKFSCGEVPASYHLTFAVDRIIPTMHFGQYGVPIDIIGNQKNSLRYLKNKIWNGLQPIPMTDEIWDAIKKYVKYRKEAADERNELTRHAQCRGCKELPDEG